MTLKARVTKLEQQARVTNPYAGLSEEALADRLSIVEDRLVTEYGVDPSTFARTDAVTEFLKSRLGTQP